MWLVTVRQVHFTLGAHRTRRRGLFVITPRTFVASANCGRYCGANIDFVDIDPKTGLMSIPKLAKA